MGADDDLMDHQQALATLARAADGDASASVDGGAGIGLDSLDLIGCVRAIDRATGNDTITDFGRDAIAVLGRLSERIAAASTPHSRAQMKSTSQQQHMFSPHTVTLLLIEIVRFFVKWRTAEPCSFSASLGGWVALLYGEMFQTHYSNEDVCTSLFSFTSDHGDWLVMYHSEALCSSFPTTIKALALRPWLLVGKHLDPIVIAMVNCNLCVTLVQAVIDIPVLACALDRLEQRLSESEGSQASRPLFESVLVDARYLNSLLPVFGGTLKRREDDVDEINLFNLLSVSRLDGMCRTVEPPLLPWKSLSLPPSGLHSTRQPELTISDLIPDLLNTVFARVLGKPSLENLSSVFQIVLSRLATKAHFPGEHFSGTLVACFSDFAASALHLKPAILTTLFKEPTFGLMLGIAHDEGDVDHSASPFSKMKVSILREVGIVLSQSREGPLFERIAHQVVESLEELLLENAKVWQVYAISKEASNTESLRLVCTTLTTMARIVMRHGGLRDGVTATLRKVSSVRSAHPFVLNRAKELLKLVQKPELGQALLMQETGGSLSRSITKKAAKLVL